MRVINLQRELLGVTLSLASFSFATGLVGVFVPLVMLNAGAPLWQVPAFYVAYAITKLVVNYPIARFVVQKRGVHAAFAFGFTAAVIELGALQLFIHTNNHWWLAVAAVALAFVNGSLWLSQHLHISAVIADSGRSSSMATIQTVNQVLMVAAPFIGGVIGAAFGPTWLITIAMVFLLLAFFPLRMVGRLEARREARDEQLKYSMRGAPKRDLFANYCWNVESSTGELVWPIFLAIEVATFKGIGLITAFSSLFMVVALWFAGRRGDKGGDRRVLVEASTISSVVNIARLFVSGIAGMTAVSAIYRSSLSYGQVAWASSYYGNAKRNGPQWVMAMEIVCDIAYLSYWSLLLVLAAVFPKNVLFDIAFTIAACTAWGNLVMRPDSGPKGEY